ncbi:MAG: Crp/Fnr family transcriptional regulator [Chitinophagaceae bacterium]|nr:MAG: Crp/Fnr family transcriptional regulator [Chitinophagaceae bacterium]
MFDKIRQYYLSLVPRLTDAQLDVLDTKLIVRQVKKGEYIVRAGEVSRFVSFMNYGLAHLFYRIDDGKDISVAFFRDGDYIAEYESFLTRAPAQLSIEALADTEIVDLGYDDMQALYRDHDAFQEFGRRISECLFINLNQRNTALLSLSPEDRYRHMIASQPALMQLVPQYMLASYIGVTPEHLSRIRRKMAISTQ